MHVRIGTETFNIDHIVKVEVTAFAIHIDTVNTTDSWYRSIYFKDVPEAKAFADWWMNIVADQPWEEK